MKILITGAHGQVGHALQATLTEHECIALDRQALDITDGNAIAQNLSQHQPDLLINTAAYTAVDLAEEEREQAFAINAQGPKLLAQACHNKDIPLIHFSTDYVFDGHAQSPISETQPTHPINYYGESKLAGERAIAQGCEKHIILRLSAVFAKEGRNFVNTMLRLAAEREALRVVEDQITCPTSALHIAQVVQRLIHKLEEGPLPWGIYHYCDGPIISWHGFAEAIITRARELQPLKVKQITAIPSTAFPQAAQRPAYSVLDTKKLMDLLNIQPFTWHHALDNIFNIPVTS